MTLGGGAWTAAALATEGSPSGPDTLKPDSGLGGRRKLATSRSARGRGRRGSAVSASSARQSIPASNPRMVTYSLRISVIARSMSQPSVWSRRSLGVFGERLAEALRERGVPDQEAVLLAAEPAVHGGAVSSAHRRSPIVNCTGEEWCWLRVEEGQWA